MAVHSTNNAIAQNTTAMLPTNDTRKVFICLAPDVIRSLSSKPSYAALTAASMFRAASEGSAEAEDPAAPSYGDFCPAGESVR